MRSSAIVVIPALAASLHAAPQVYEGFNYPSGSVPITSMNTGLGWSGGFTGAFGGATPNLAPITPGSLLRPESPAPTGNALSFYNQTNTGPSLTRAIAQPLATSQTVWMSAIVNLTNLPSAGELRLGEQSPPGTDANTPGVVFFTGGYGLDTGAAFPSYLPWPDPAPGPLVYFLLRLGPASGNQRQMDLWMNPGISGLGAPNLSRIGDAVIVSRFTMNLGDYTGIDEIRIDTNLANVYIPAPSALAPLILAALPLQRRRRPAPVASRA